MGKIYTIKQEQVIPVSVAEAWQFFSRGDNLQKITPAELAFKVTSAPQRGEIYAGQLITYIIKPVLGIPLQWITEITHVQPLRYFVDEQRDGPYRLWHHEHHFEVVAEGVRMTDLVYYQLPLGWLGRLAHVLFVKKQLQHIFNFRKQRITALFGGAEK
jgi:ligand-binding SRPBCC domain-containing protein